MEHNFENLPLVLSVAHVQSILGIGRVQAYQLVNSADFPTIRIGKSIRIPRDKFLKWLDENAEKKSQAMCI